MNRNQQISLVNELCMRMALDLGTKIDAGEVPKEWDGHELRCLVADKATDNASVSLIRKEQRGARAKAYKNTILTTNIL
jgi:hypothetical protein